MLISIHIPKTAGTSFGALLRQRFGTGLLEDYEDRPLARAAVPRLAQAVAQWPASHRRLAGYDAVHGHFLALKYLPVRGDVVTWLRHPAQRVVSRYEHYRRDVAAERRLPPVAGLRPGLTLDEFSRIPRFRNTCAKYLRGFPRQRVACYGFSEDVAEGLARMQRVLGLELGPSLHANANPAKSGSHYLLEPSQERRLIALNAQDYRLWCWAREREGN
jgi:hypothetical protein